MIDENYIYTLPSGLEGTYAYLIDLAFNTELSQEDAYKLYSISLAKRQNGIAIDLDISYCITI